MVEFPQYLSPRRLPAAMPAANVDAPLTLVVTLAEALADARDFAGVGRALFAFLRPATDGECILVALYDQASQERTCVYSAGDDGEDDVSGLPAMPLNAGPQSRAVETGAVVIVGDLDRALCDNPVVNVGTERDPRLTASSIAMPMKLRGATVGVLEVQSYRANAFSRRHVQVLRLAAEMAALALETVRTTSSTRRQAEIHAARRRVAAVIADRAFVPVFQPVVELASGRIVGYEALTRFADRTPPDRAFLQADGCGLGPALEIATLQSIIQAAPLLPAGAWLSVNVSPHLVLTGQPLRDLLTTAGRQVVLEVTEHATVDDYDLFARSLRELPPATELAIDDAGAGYASLRHIIELRPRYVKLDRHLIGGIDIDPGRQALIGALAEFGRASGTVLVAEGVETEPELQTLLALGIPLGQGYRLGRPAPAAAQRQAAWPGTPPSGRPAGARSRQHQPMCT
jgi:EAL domain-containing protein (putative c-di-GMP-specific phosphodiesterase class I)